MSSKFARNSIFSTIGGVWAALGSFLSMLIIARILGVERMGVVSFVTWLVTLVVAFIDFGVASTLSRYLPELTVQAESDQAARLTSFLLLPYALATLMTLVVFALYAAWVWAGAAPHEFSHPGGINWRANPAIWLLIGVACSLQSLGSFALGYLRGMQRFDRAASLTGISLALQLLAVAMGSVFFGVEGAIGGFCTGSVLPALTCLSLAKVAPKVSSDLRVRVIRFALYAWAAGFAFAFIWSRTEIFFLERFWGNEAVGLFTIGLAISQLATQGPVLLTGGLLPYFSEESARNAFGMRSGFATATRVMAFLVFPICFGAAAIVPALVPLIYGTAFSGGAPAAAVLVSTAAFGAIATVAWQLIYGKERSDFIFFSGLAGALLSVAAALVLVPAFGIMGAAWTRAAVNIFMGAVACWFVSQRLHCPIPFDGLGRLVLAAALCALSARLSLTILSGVVGLVVSIITGAMIYVWAVRIFRALPEIDARRLRTFSYRLPAYLSWPAQVVLRLICPI